MKKPLSLAKAVAYYLECRSQLGFELKADHFALRSLVRYAREVGHRGPLTQQLALRWAQLPQQANPLWRARRLDMARRFARFWVHFDPRTAVPPVGVLGPSYRRRPVHIYSAEEILALLGATSQLAKNHSTTAATFKTLLGLLAASGLRVSEALRLQWQDIDWTRGLLRVLSAKSGAHRQIPLHRSTLAALKRYQQRCRKTLPSEPGAALFRTPQAKAMNYEQARRAFGSVRAHLGWLQQPRPRLHDLRHTFAVNCLLRWYEQDQEIGHRILALSTYLGHRRVSDTYWYLSAVPQLLSLARQRWEKQTLQLPGGLRA
jgi:integrase